MRITGAAIGGLKQAACSRAAISNHDRRPLAGLSR
jgi:hypothetical protein